MCLMINNTGWQIGKQAPRVKLVNQFASENTIFENTNLTKFKKFVSSFLLGYTVL